MANETYSTFADRLNDILEKRGISQNWLAEKSNTTPATVNRYLKRVHGPTLEIAANIAKALNVSLDYLVGNTNTMAIADEADRENATLINCYFRAPQNIRDIIWVALNDYTTSAEKAFVASLKDNG